MTSPAMVENPTAKPAPARASPVPTLGRVRIVEGLPPTRPR